MICEHHQARARKLGFHYEVHESSGTILRGALMRVAQAQEAAQEVVDCCETPAMSAVSGVFTALTEELSLLPEQVREAVEEDSKQRRMWGREWNAAERNDYQRKVEG